MKNSIIMGLALLCLLLSHSATFAQAGVSIPIITLTVNGESSEISIPESYVENQQVLTIAVSVFNASGSVVYSNTSTGAYPLELELTLASGDYSIQVQVDDWYYEQSFNVP